jgi:hypothetical protein
MATRPALSVLRHYPFFDYFELPLNFLPLPGPSVFFSSAFVFFDGSPPFATFIELPQLSPTFRDTHCILFQASSIFIDILQSRHPSPATFLVLASTVLEFTLSLFCFFDLPSCAISSICVSAIIDPPWAPRIHSLIFFDLTRLADSRHS